MNITDAEIAQAVHRYCLRAFSEDLTMDPPFRFSERHIAAMSEILGKADKKKAAKRILTHIAIYAAAVLLIFAAVCISSPKVWAAVRSWYVYNIGPDQTVFEFEHIDHDYAFLVARPGTLPDGMALKSAEEGDDHCVLRYEDASCEKYLKFSYHWLTVRERRKIDKLTEQYGTISLAMGYAPVFYEEDGANKMAWYDTYSLIGYWVESNLSREEIVAAFDNMELHPPVYVPTWLPEGYELVDSYYDGASCDLVYCDNETSNLIMISVSDYGWLPQISVFGEGQKREVTINGNEGIVCWGDGFYEGTVLFVIDKEQNLVIHIQTSLINPDMAVEIAENLSIQSDKVHP